MATKLRMMMNCFLLNALIVVNVSSETLIINKVDDDRALLISDILSLALQKSSPNSHLNNASEKLPLARLVEEVKSGNVDILWGSSGEKLESALLPIRIPILQGVLGYRVFIIREDMQARFDKVKTLAQLKEFSAGQVSYWGDTKVLKSAGLPVITTLKYKNLIYMLEGGRFDYFPRGIHEISSEVAMKPEFDITVENNILLVYPYAMYFYTNKDNKALHDKILRGLEMAIADGSYQTLFFNNPLIKDALYKHNIKNRTVIRIDNPNMHPDTPFDRDEFWLKIEDL